MLELLELFELVEDTLFSGLSERLAQYALSFGCL
jgi:hypothetical protein